jgi:hypothetical protein
MLRLLSGSIFVAFFTSSDRHGRSSAFDVRLEENVVLMEKSDRLEKRVEVWRNEWYYMEKVVRIPTLWFPPSLSPTDRLLSFHLPPPPPRPSG